MGKSWRKRTCGSASIFNHRKSSWQIFPSVVVYCVKSWKHSLLVKITKGLFLQGSGGTGIFRKNKVLWKFGGQYSLRVEGKWDQGGSVVPQSSTCSGVSGQWITAAGSGGSLSFPTPQASKLNPHGKLTLRRAGEKAVLLNFPGLLFYTSSFRFEAQRQVPICKAALGNPWPVVLPHNEKGSRMLKRLLKF